MPFNFKIKNTPHIGDKVKVTLNCYPAIMEEYECEVIVGVETVASIYTFIADLINTDSVNFTAQVLNSTLIIDQVSAINYGDFLGKGEVILNNEGLPKAVTIVHDEVEQSFLDEVSYIPEGIVSVGSNRFVTFKYGTPYIHDSDIFNNFYGEQYESYIIGVMNDNLSMDKRWLSLQELTSHNTIWEVDARTSLEVLGVMQETELREGNFRVLQGKPTAAFLRDKNSAGGLYEGLNLKGNFIILKFILNSEKSSNLATLAFVTVKYTV